MMTISKDRSTHSESSILQICSSWNIYLMHDLTYHNSDKDGDQNTESPCDQLDCNVGTYHSNVELEQVKLKLLEGIQRSQTKLVWSNLEYENCFDFHILSHVIFY
jgi:hypothetical protein